MKSVPHVLPSRIFLTYPSWGIWKSSKVLAGRGYVASQEINIVTQTWVCLRSSKPSTKPTAHLSLQHMSSLIPWRLDVISFCFAGLSKSGFAKGGLSLWTRKIGCDSYIPISINNYKHHCNIKYHICIWYFHITTKNYTSLWSLSAQNQGLDSFWCHVHCQAQQRPRIFTNPWLASWFYHAS